MVLVEICTDNWKDTLSAIQLGADRIELCSSLDLDGLTPTEALFMQCKQEFPHIPIFVMIRCKSGDFVYSDTDKQEMISTANRFVELGAEGLVIGALTKEGKIDYAFISDFAHAVRSRNPSVQITFHKAFDALILSAGESFNDVATKLAPYCDRILTSGGRNTALEGAHVIREIRSLANGPTPIAAGGIRSHNVMDVLRLTGASEIHSKCPNIIPVVRGISTF